MYVRLISNALLTTSKSQWDRFSKTNVTFPGEPGMMRALLIRIDNCRASVLEVDSTLVTCSLSLCWRAFVPVPVVNEALRVLQVLGIVGVIPKRRRVVSRFSQRGQL